MSISSGILLGMPLGQKRGAGFSLANSIKQFSRVVLPVHTSTCHGWEFGTFRVLGTHSLSHHTALVLGMQCCSVVLFLIVLLSIEAKPCPHIYWPLGYPFLWYACSRFSHWFYVNSQCGSALFIVKDHPFPTALQCCLSDNSRGCICEGLFLDSLFSSICSAPSTTPS